MHRAARAILAATMLAATLAGCYSTTTYVPPKTDQTALVTVYRPSSVVLSGLAAYLEVDGATVARVRSGEYVEFAVAPGSHVLRAKAQGFADARELAIEAAAGQRVYVSVQPKSENAAAATAAAADPTPATGMLWAVGVEPFRLDNRAGAEFDAARSGLEPTAIGD